MCDGQTTEQLTFEEGDGVKKFKVFKQRQCFSCPMDARYDILLDKGRGWRFVCPGHLLVNVGRIKAGYEMEVVSGEESTEPSVGSNRAG